MTRSLAAVLVLCLAALAHAQLRTLPANVSAVWMLTAQETGK